MKKNKMLLSAGIVVFLLFSCQKEINRSNAELIIKAYTSPVFKSATGDFSTIVIDTILMNIKDIEFEFDESYAGVTGTDHYYDDDIDDFNNDDVYDDIEAEGPYLIDVLSPEVLNGMVLDGYSIPNAVYDEIEFEFACYRLTDNNKMQGRSIYVAGTINGNRFNLWTNKVGEIEIDFDDDRSIDLTSGNIKLYIDISLGKIKANLEAMNLASAVDGNKNGIIEIGFNDIDGNQALSGSLLKAVTGCFDLDDYNDDHDDDCYDEDDDED